MGSEVGRDGCKDDVTCGVTDNNECVTFHIDDGDVCDNEGYEDGRVGEAASSSRLSGAR